MEEVHPKQYLSNLVGILSDFAFAFVMLPAQSHPQLPSTCFAVPAICDKSWKPRSRRAAFSCAFDLRQLPGQAGHIVCACFPGLTAVWASFDINVKGFSTFQYGM